MKIHVPNAMSASGPTMYGGIESIPITNLPLFLTRYETRFEDARGQVVWSSFSLKPSNDIGIRRLNMQMRCYLFDDPSSTATTSLTIRCRFAPEDPVYSQYIIDVPWSASSVDGYMTIQNQDHVIDISDKVTFQYLPVENELVIYLSPPREVQYQTIFLNMYI